MILYYMFQATKNLLTPITIYNNKNISMTKSAISLRKIKTITQSLFILIVTTVLTSSLIPHVIDSENLSKANIKEIAILIAAITAITLGKQMLPLKSTRRK